VALKVFEDFFGLILYNFSVKTDNSYSRMANFLLLVGPLAALAVSPMSNFDPINLIKLLCITTIAFFIFGLILSSFKAVVSRIEKWFWVSIAMFVFAMISTLIFSGAPITQQIWGSFGRNTGFLTYFSLLIILVGTAIVQKVDFYRRLVNSLVFTAVPMTFYCLIQIAKLDPIGWSEKYPFGTLGNINFSSGFFGLTSIAGTILLLEKKISLILRFGIGTMVLTDLLIVYSTGSIQGLMSFVAAIGVAGYLYLRGNSKLKLIKIPYVAIALIGFSGTLLGLINKGPLASFIYAPSVVFRGDYMHAGWAMTWSHPFFGVGLDSYGDWYRSARGLISTTRNNPERIANTAHNIFLDISSNGGIPMITGYLLLLFFALRAIIRVLNRDKVFRPYFVALLATWFGYQIQSLISINQVGVGIWGWLFTGAIIGYEICTRDVDIDSLTTSKNFSKKKNRNNGVTLSAGAGVISFATAVLGFTLSFIPLNADMAYKKALQTGDLIKVMDSVKILGSSAFHSEMALQGALKGNYVDQAKVITDRILEKYPRDFMAWRSRAFIGNPTPDVRSEAIAKLRELDPYNPEIPKS